MIRHTSWQYKECIHLSALYHPLSYLWECPYRRQVQQPWAALQSWLWDPETNNKATCRGRPAPPSRLLLFCLSLEQQWWMVAVIKHTGGRQDQRADSDVISKWSTPSLHILKPTLKEAYKRPSLKLYTMLLRWQRWFPWRNSHKRWQTLPPTLKSDVNDKRDEFDPFSHANCRCCAS